MKKNRRPDPAWFDFDGLTEDEVWEVREAFVHGRRAALAAAGMHEFEGSQSAAKSWRRCALHLLRLQRRLGLAHPVRP